jgi:hypothetical protein
VFQDGLSENELRELTGGDMAKPIVTMSFNAARFGSYNLALRIRHAGGGQARRRADRLVTSPSTRRCSANVGYPPYPVIRREDGERQSPTLSCRSLPSKAMSAHAPC